MDALKVKPTHDGTYTIYKGAHRLASGLTRAQVDAYLADHERRRAARP